MTLTDLISYNTSIEALCFVTALICLHNDNKRIWQSMIWYTFIVTVTEVTGRYLKLIHLPNAIVYNVFSVIDTIFMSLMLNHLFRVYTKSHTIMVCILTVFFSCFIYETITNGLINFHSMAYNIVSVLYMIASLYYYYLLLKDDSYIDLRRSSGFWWVAGLLFFYFGSTVVNLLRGKLQIKIGEHYVTYYIYIALNLLLYGCWSYAFICRKWITRSTRSYS